MFPRELLLGLASLAAICALVGCGGQSGGGPNAQASGSLTLPGHSGIGFRQNTTLAAETGNNTSTAEFFRAQPNGNAAAGNVSKISIRNLLYSAFSANAFSFRRDA